MDQSPVVNYLSYSEIPIKNWAKDRIFAKNTQDCDQIVFKNTKDFSNPDLAERVFTAENTGRIVWALLHAYAYHYPLREDDNIKTTSQWPTQQEKNDMLNLVQTVIGNYPCPKCRKHGSLLLRTIQPDLDSKETFMRWLSNFHSAISYHIHFSQSVVLEDE